MRLVLQLSQVVAHMRQVLLLLAKQITRLAVWLPFRRQALHDRLNRVVQSEAIQQLMLLSSIARIIVHQNALFCGLQGINRSSFRHLVFIGVYLSRVYRLLLGRNTW